MMQVVHRAPSKPAKTLARVILYLNAEYRVQVHMPSRKKFMTTNHFPYTPKGLAAAKVQADGVAERYARRWNPS